MTSVNIHQFYGYSADCQRLLNGIPCRRNKKIRWQTALRPTEV